MTTHSTARTWLRIALLTLGAAAVLAVTLLLGNYEIGRASCRERV